jgi:predicted O-methyltransferase YrrM
MMDSRIHVVPAGAWRAYQDKRLANLRMLGPALRLDLWLRARGVTEIQRYDAAKDWVAFHAWRRGFVDLDDGELLALRAGTATPLSVSLASRGWLDAGPVDVGGLMLRAILDFGALQNPWELERFLGRVAERAPRTIVEIGTSSGGLLFALAQLADPEAVIVSVDIPEIFDKPDAAAAVPRVLEALVRPGQSFHAKRERSTLHAVRAEVAALLAGRPVDLLVIDGDHSYGGVRIDFEMYSGLVAPGGLVAFHDVLIRPENSGRGFEVGLYWDELQRTHRTETIADPAGVPGTAAQEQLPFPQRRPAALGWGLLFT